MKIKVTVLSIIAFIGMLFTSCEEHELSKVVTVGETGVAARINLMTGFELDGIDQQGVLKSATLLGEISFTPFIEDGFRIIAFDLETDEIVFNQTVTPDNLSETFDLTFDAISGKTYHIFGLDEWAYSSLTGKGLTNSEIYQITVNPSNDPYTSFNVYSAGVESLRAEMTGGRWIFKEGYELFIPVGRTEFSLNLSLRPMPLTAMVVDLDLAPGVENLSYHDRLSGSSLAFEVYDENSFIKFSGTVESTDLRFVYFPSEVAVDLSNSELVLDMGTEDKVVDLASWGGMANNRYAYFDVVQSTDVTMGVSFGNVQNVTVGIDGEIEI